MLDKDVSFARQPDDWLGDVANNIGSTRAIRKALFSTLEDLDFTDDLALVSHTHQHMQEKTTHLTMFAQQISLKISQKKKEVMMLDVPNPSQVKVNGEEQLKNSPTSSALSGMMVEQAATSESPQQGQEHLQNAKQQEEVIQAQHQDQATV